MGETLRYGIIGAGMMGREHVRNIALIPGSVVTALSDPDEGSRAESARAVGGDVAVFADHRDLLERGEIDVVLIASPNDTHKRILDDVFQAPKALGILVEKPICTSIEDVGALAKAARDHRAPIWVAMEYRYMPPVQELLREVRAGTVGALRMLSIREHRFPFLPKVGDWNRFSRRTGGTLVEKCCHFFDLMRLVARDEPVRVYASGAMDVNHRDERYGGETPDILDNAFVTVDFRSGARAMLDLCMFSEGAYWQEEIAATGDRGRVECFVPGPARFWPGGSERHSEIEISPREPKGPTRRRVEVDETLLRAGDHHGSTFYQHSKFREAVLDGAPVEVTLEDGLKAVAIGLAAELSAREHRVVEIDGLGFR
ncbi:Gfo/Idh/MocA family protein [Salinarimonas soli]|uniref:Gfo/Idh/MocA family oxidoreductase n=1 Tax=Salinarimonas soli TaxID=1638099 RepID=A0A5B2VAI5_9HYPH|nr:Gfo/Idh/MocA family oxidoreductase [Salinarimonas soli]KAA2235207.1 Gfo/Idh/MocA family oxidoreductase [Salinarimonas soli]